MSSNLDPNTQPAPTTQLIPLHRPVTRSLRGLVHVRATWPVPRIAHARDAQLRVRLQRRSLSPGGTQGASETRGKAEGRGVIRDPWGKGLDLAGDAHQYGGTQARVRHELICPCSISHQSELTTRAILLNTYPNLDQFDPKFPFTPGHYISARRILLRRNTRANHAAAWKNRSRSHSNWPRDSHAGYSDPQSGCGERLYRCAPCWTAERVSEYA